MIPTYTLVESNVLNNPNTYEIEIECDKIESGKEQLYHTIKTVLCGIQNSNFPIKKTEKTYRIITLGDSFTYGQYVKTQENWTEKLEDLLNSSLSNCDYDKFEVINLGMPGYDVQYIVQRYQDIGAKYNPDLIVWFESDSGFNRFNELMGPSIKICDNDNLNNDPEFYSTQKVYKCWRDAEEKIFEENTIEHLDGILEKSFESFFKIADQNKTIFFYYDNAWDRKDKIINKLRTQYGGVDFITSISETPNYERFVDGHPNIEGHRSLSQVFFNHLKKRIGCFE